MCVYIYIYTHFFVFLADGLLSLISTKVWAPAAGQTGSFRTNAKYVCLFVVVISTLK